MGATPETFVKTFPAFKDADRYPLPLIGFYLELSYLMLPVNRWGTLIDYGAQLLAAHNLAIEGQNIEDGASGGTPGTGNGVLGSQSAGPVSMSIDTNVASEQGAGFYNLTSYGTRFYRLVRMVGMGGIQLGAPGGVQANIMPVEPYRVAELAGNYGVPVIAERTVNPPPIPPPPCEDNEMITPAIRGGV